MRTLKSNGGLTRGNGMSDEQCVVWTIMLLPVPSLYNLEMRYFTSTTHTSSEQHKDIAKSRVERDASYLEKLYKIAVMLSICPRSFTEKKFHWTF